MVVIHRAYGFRFVIYTADHDPAHVHMTGDGQAEINLLGPYGRPQAIYSIGIKAADMRRIMTEVEHHRDAFLADWERIHGSDD